MGMQLRSLASVGSFISLFAGAVAAQTPAAPTYDFESFRARMDDPKRAEWQKPDEVVRRLRLRRGQRVADIGAGTGYFTARLAAAVGRAGTVYAVDTDARALQYMRRRFKRPGGPEIRVVRALPNDPKLPSRVDLIFFCDTWHHLDHRPTYAEVLHRYLRNNGRVVIVDFKPDADPNIGPPKEMRLSAEQITDELHQSGFRVTREPDFLPQQYVLTATPDDAEGRP